MRIYELSIVEEEEKENKKEFDPVEFGKILNDTPEYWEEEAKWNPLIKLKKEK